jgi:P-type Cu2+ transporter
MGWAARLPAPAGARESTDRHLGWAIGYNSLAIPIAGIFEPLGFTLSPAVAALSMSGSSVIAAVNAIALRRLRLPEQQRTRWHMHGRQVAD